MYQEVVRDYEALALGRERAFASGYTDTAAEAYARGFADGYIRGRTEGVRSILIRLGVQRFGPPDEPTEARIAALTDLDRLRELCARTHQVASWAELLDASGRGSN